MNDETVEINESEIVLEDTMPNWEIYEQLQAEGEIDTPGKMSILISRHMDQVREILGDDDSSLKGYEHALVIFSGMSDEAY